MTPDAAELRARFDRFRELTLPDALDGAQVAGVCVRSLDDFAAACVGSFLERGTLDGARRSGLRGCASDLADVARALDGEGRAYFTALGELVDGVLAHLPP